MKKIKKILMALAICSVSFIAVGCSSKSDNDNNNNNNNNNTNNNQKKENTISAEELSNKILEASKAVKSTKVKVQSKVKVIFLEKEQLVIQKLNQQFH